MSSSQDENVEFVQEIFIFLHRFVGELSLIQLSGVLQNILICAMISFFAHYFLANSRRKDQSISSRRKWILYGLFISLLLLSSGIYFSYETFTRNRIYGKNYYELLGIPKFNAVDSKAVDRAYRQASHKYHPDKYSVSNLGISKEEATKILYELQTAKIVLGDKDLKYLYDHYGYRSTELNKMFEDMDSSTGSDKEKKIKRKVVRMVIVLVKSLFLSIYHFCIWFLPFLFPDQQLLVKWLETQKSKLLEKRETKKKQIATYNLSNVNAVISTNPDLVWHVLVGHIYLFLKIFVIVLGIGSVQYLLPFTPEFEILLIIDMMFISLFTMAHLLFSPYCLNLYKEDFLGSQRSKKDTFNMVDILVGLEVDAGLGFSLALVGCLKNIQASIAYVIKYILTILTPLAWIMIIRMYFDLLSAESRDEFAAMLSKLLEEGSDKTKYTEEEFKFLATCQISLVVLFLRHMFYLPVFPVFAIFKEKIEPILMIILHKDGKPVDTTTTTTTKVIKYEVKTPKAKTPKATH